MELKEDSCGSCGRLLGLFAHAFLYLGCINKNKCIRAEVVYCLFLAVEKSVVITSLLLPRRILSFWLAV